MKKNNNSIYFKDWTTSKLKKEALEFDDIIHGQNACYGSHDIQHLDGVLAELDKRGIEVNTKLTFN